MNFLEKKIAEFKKLGLRGFLDEYQISFIILGIFIVAFVLRVYDIGNIPPGFSGREADTVNSIKGISPGNLLMKGSIYSALYVYLGFLWTKLFGLTVENLRIFSALLGGATVVLSYVFISKWFSRKIAIFTALLFGISSFHITVSRLIVPEIALPLVVLSLFVALTYAYRTKNIWLFGISGFLAGLGFYTSPAFILVLVLFAISGVYFFTKNKRFFTSYKLETISFFAGFVSIMIPYAVSFFGDPMKHLSYYVFPDSLSRTLMNISEVPYILFVRAPISFFENIGGEPLVDPLIFVTSVFGFFFAILAIKRRKYFFLIFWLLVFFAYAVFKESVNTLGLLGILPALYALSALIIDYILDRWLETFPYNLRARIFAVGLISIFFALSMLYNFDKYFVAYRYSEEVREEFSFPAEIPLNNN
ncbi:MAG: glycosyltransferase family 39 protein [Patescibacteria group bacterium]|nr:glycosyltransferase family 39 protein [Patescibacteria group bacterium]